MNLRATECRALLGLAIPSLALLGLWATLLSSLGCSGKTSSAQPRSVAGTGPRAASGSAALPATLLNATYVLPGASEGKLRMTDGEWRGRDADGDFSVHLFGLWAKGDLNGDPTEDAVVLLEEIHAGQASRFHLVPVFTPFETPDPLTPCELGAGIAPRSLMISSRKIFLDLFSHGTDDSSGAPPRLEQRGYGVRNRELLRFDR